MDMRAAEKRRSGEAEKQRTSRFSGFSLARYVALSANRTHTQAESADASQLHLVVNKYKLG